MKDFFIRLLHHLIAFSAVLLVALPIITPLFWSAFAKLYTGHWKSWDWMLDTLIWGWGKGLILTPSIAFAMTCFEYGIYRGWWRG